MGPIRIIKQDILGLNTMQHLITVVIPTYNRGGAIQRTVDSVLAQDLPPEEVEIIVVDDGSTDDTWQVLHRLYEGNSSVQLFSIPNGGVANARNVGLEKARGEFIAFLDHDDFWLPAKLRLQREKMQNPSVGVVYCLWIATDEQGAPAPSEVQHSQHPWWQPQKGDIYPWILMPDPHQMLRNPIYSMTFPLVRTQLLRAIGGFDPALVPSDDWDLWVRLAKITHFDYVPQVLAYYVQHDRQQHKALEPAVRSWLRMCLKHPVGLRDPVLWFKQFSFNLFCRDQMFYCKAKKELFSGNYQAMMRHAVCAFTVRPDRILKKYWLYLFMRAFTRNTDPY